MPTKAYERAEFVISEFDREDVITTSGESSSVPAPNMELYEDFVSW